MNRSCGIVKRKSLGDQLAAFLKIRFQMLLDFQKAEGRDLLVGQRKGI